METFGVVEFEIPLQTEVSLRRRLVIVKINLLVLDRSPQTLDKNIVKIPTATVHADSDPLVLQYTGEILVGKLCSLIAVEYLRLFAIQRFLQCLHAERALKSIGQTPGKNVTREPINHCRQIEKAPAKTNIRDIGAPDLVNMINQDIA